jgi:hypothetical protein
MPVTKDDVRKEHEDALVRMDEHQLRAIARINRAFRESRFGNRSAKDAMEDVYEEEARERNRKAADASSARQDG